MADDLRAAEVLKRLCDMVPTGAPSSILTPDDLDSILRDARVALAQTPPAGEEARERVIEAAKRRRDAFAAYERAYAAQGPFSLPPEAEWQAYVDAVWDEDSALALLDAARPQPAVPAPPVPESGAAGED